jgi:hypothetical protein
MSESTSPTPERQKPVDSDFGDHAVLYELQDRDPAHVTTDDLVGAS